MAVGRVGQGCITKRIETPCVVLVVVQSQASVLGTSAIAQVVGVVRTQEDIASTVNPNVSCHLLSAQKVALLEK